MEENLNIFGKNLGEIGSLDKNLVLRTKGQVYIRFGRKYIELLDNKGNLNVKIPKFIFKVNSESEMKSNGIYLLDDNVYVYYDGDIILLTGTESEFVSYAIELNLTQEQINIALNNIGLTFNSIDEALQTIDEGIFFVGDSIYYTKDGEYVELTFTLNYPLKDINEAELTRYPQGNYQTIVFINGRWVYSSIVTKEEFNSLDFDFTLNTPLLEINNASELQTLPDKLKEETPTEGEETPSEEPSGDNTPSEEPTGDDTPSEEDPDYKNMPWAIVYKGNDAWAYEKVVPYEFFKKCCDEVKAEIEELKDKTKTFIVTWLNKDGTEFATTTVQNGQSAPLPNGLPDVKHWDFDKWDYNNEPITEDISINSEWKYVPPKIFIECNPSSVENTGGEVLVLYWVKWDGDLILEDITVEGSSSNIDYSIDEEIIIENNKINRKIIINESTYSSLGKIYFKASFMGEEGDEEGMGMVYAETTLIQKPAGAIELPEFDLMKFSAEWEKIPDTTEDMSEVEGWVLLDDGITWTYDNGKSDPFKTGDLDIRTYTSLTYIPILYSTKKLDKYEEGGHETEEIKLSGYLVGYGSGGEDFSQISIGKIYPIRVLKNKTEIYDIEGIEVTEKTIKQYNIENNKEETEKLDNYDLYLYLIWSGDCIGSGGEYTVLNFGKIINNILRVNQKAIFIYMEVRWYAYNGSGKFNITYDIYKLDNDESGLYSPKNEYNFYPEDDSVKKLSIDNNVLENLEYCETSITWKNYPIATLWYDLKTQEITFLKGYYTEEDIYGSSTSGESFIWTEPKSNPESSSEEEQNDNNN